MKKVIILLTFGIILITTSIWAVSQSQQKRYPVISTEEATENSPSWFDNLAATPLPTPSLPEITSIDQVVFENQSPLEPSDYTISLLATGDVLLARTINKKMVELQDFTWPFVFVAPFLQQADITYINLETPLVSDCPPRLGGMSFCGDTRGIQSLEYAGIDVVNVANNHASNFGHEGVDETEKLLKTNNFVISGIDGNNVGFKTVKNTKFAFLGYNEVNDQEGVTSVNDAVITREVAQANTQADIVVAQFHWGNEYTYKPSENQKRLSRLAIDAGADLIIGNHPHWYQPIEFYNNKLIIYSHGNLVFDQMWSRETREGVVGEYLFADKKLVGVRFVPILIENYGQPKILEGTEATQILGNMKKESYLLKTKAAEVE